MKKRILALVLALCLLTSLLPVAVFATEVETQEGLAAPVVELKQDDDGSYYLSWERVPGAVSYEVYRSTDGAKYTLWGWPKYARHNISRGDAGNRFYYKVIALDKDGNCSADSNVIEHLVRHEQPQITVTKDEATGLISISWEPIIACSQYKVYRSTTGEEGSWTRISTTSKTSVTNTKNMVLGTEYFYKVVAIGKIEEANSIDSEVKSAVYTLVKPIVTVAYDSAKNGVKVSWEPIEGAVQYKVYRSLTGEDGSWSRISTTTKTTVTNTKNFDRTQKYYYKVIALAENEAGNSEYSDVQVYLGKLPAPEVTVSNIESSGKIQIKWTKVDGAVKYELYRATSKTGTYTLLSTTKGTSFRNTSATAGTTYYYKVRALAADPAANSDFSAIKSRTCDLPCPVLTAGVTTKGQPKVTWKAVDGAVSYKVYRSTTLDGNYSLTKTTTSTTYTNTTAVAYETYYYKVVAVASNTAANSAKSAAKGISCTTVNITPSKLSKDFVNRINEYRDYFGIDELEWHKDGELTCRTRAAEYHLDFTGDRPDGRSVDKMLEAGKVQIELGLQADATAEDVVDVLMYYDDYEDYAAILMYEGWDYAVVACNNGYWCIMFG